MLIGYARVSTADQNLDLQIDALEHAGCSQIFFDKASGTKTDRPELQKALDACQTGDTVVVWKLDRLGRSLQHLIAVVTTLNEKGIGFRTVCDGIDTTTSSGKLVFHIFAALAEFERNLIRDRTLAGLRAANQRGRKGGRPQAMTPERVAVAKKLFEAGANLQDVATLLGVSKSTLWRYQRKLYGS